MNRQVKAHLILVLTTFISGANFSISKLVMPEYITAPAVILIRGIFAILVFTILDLVIVKESFNFKKDGRSLFICALTGVVINQYMFYQGLSRTSPINAAFIMISIPIIVLLLSAMFFNERITALKVGGIFLGTIGALLLLSSGQYKEGKQGLVGDLMVFTNAVSYAVFLIFAKPLMHKYHPLTIVKWIFIIGFIMLLPVGYKNVTLISWEIIPLTALLSLGYIVLFATIFAYLLNVAVLKDVNPAIAGSYIYFQPVVATAIAILLNQDDFSLLKAFYAILIFTGIFMVSWKGAARKRI